jgi:hypothetical protein
MKAERIEGLNARGSLRGQLPEVFVVRMNELWQLSRHMPFEDRVLELHDMRIAAKRLRYCFEFFQPLFGAGFNSHLKEFKQLQDYLGEIHDCDIWVDYLREELKLAMQELGRSRRELDSFIGASQELGEAARALESEYRDGPAGGLLRMISELTQRRHGLYLGLLKFWRRLEESGFQQSLATDVMQAAAQPGNPAQSTEPVTEEL